MSNFNLKILAPGSVIIDRDIKKLIVRTTEGDVGILRNHIDYVAGIKSGLITITNCDDTTDKITIKDGFVSVYKSNVTIMSIDT